MVEYGRIYPIIREAIDRQKFTQIHVYVAALGVPHGIYDIVCEITSAAVQGNASFERIEAVVYECACNYKMSVNDLKALRVNLAPNMRTPDIFKISFGRFIDNLDSASRAGMSAEARAKYISQYRNALADANARYLSNDFMTRVKNNTNVPQESTSTETDEDVSPFSKVPSPPVVTAKVPKAQSKAEVAKASLNSRSVSFKAVETFGLFADAPKSFGL